MCLDVLLRALGTAARAPDACDTTCYGMSRSSPRSFYAHHAAAISAAVAAHESLALENAAVSLSRRLLAHPSPTAHDRRHSPPLTSLDSVAESDGASA